MAASSACTVPRGVSKALRQRANGSRIGACDVPKRTNVSTSLGMAFARARVGAPVSDGASPRIDVRGDQRAHRAARAIAVRDRRCRARAVAVGLREAGLVDVALEGGSLAVVRAAGVGGGAHGGLRELALDARARGAEHGPFEEETALELLGEAHDEVRREGLPDLGRGLGGDLLARETAVEADDDRRERRRNHGMTVRHSLRVAEDEDPAMLLVRHHDRLDGAEHWAGAGVHSGSV